MPKMTVYDLLGEKFTIDRHVATIKSNHANLDTALSKEIDPGNFAGAKPTLEKALKAFNETLDQDSMSSAEKQIIEVARDGLNNYLQSKGQSWENPATASAQQASTETPSNAAPANTSQTEYQKLIEPIRLQARLEALHDKDGPAKAAINLLTSQEDQLKDKTQAEILAHMKAILADSNQSDSHDAANFAVSQITESMDAAPAATTQQNQSADADASLERPAQTTENAQKTTASSTFNDLMKPISEVPNKPGSYHVPPESVGKIISTVNKNHGSGLNALGKQGYGVINEAEAQAILGDQKKLAQLVTEMTGVQPGTPNFKAAQDHVKNALKGVGKGGCVGLAVSTKASRAALHKDIQTATNGKAKFVERKGPSQSARAPTPAPPAKRQRAESETSKNDPAGKALDTTAEPSPTERQAAFTRGATNGKATRRLRSNSAPAATTDRSNEGSTPSSLEP